MVNYQVAVLRPFQDVGKAIIGIILSMIPIVGLLVTGFAVRAAKNTMNGNDELPDWSDGGSLFVTGLTVMIICVLYVLPVFLILFIGSIIAYTVGSTDVIEGSVVAGITTLIATMLFFGAIFISPMAAMNYVSNGKFTSALDIRDIFRRAFTGVYVVAWFAMMVYLVVIVTVTEFIPVLGWGIAAYVLKVTTMTVFAEAYAETS